MSDESSSCPKCGSPLAPGAGLGGMCARCLMAGVFEVSPRAGGNAPFELPPAEELASQFTDLEVQSLAGHGGMGAVYRARQKSLDRDVALKILPLDLLEDESFLERFQREGRVMAQLAHPGVARIFDAGITDSGRPYLVMEFLEGKPVTAFCEDHRLPLRQRLSLFQEICAAVQHAHGKAIIHRDLKPGNILVVDADGAPAAKVIDFGLSRSGSAAESWSDRSDSSDSSVPSDITRAAGQLLGTPGYLSPEQAAGADVDTRTDIYALGVLLRVLTEPAPPEICAIAARAAAEDREARYATAAALAEDVQRFLDGHAVLAMPQTAGYRARKFLRRHRAGVGVTAAVIAALTGALVFALSKEAEARRGRDAARIAQARSERARDFMKSVLSAAIPFKEGRDVKAADLLPAAAARAEKELAAEPLILAEVLDTLGYTYYQLAIYDKAEPLLRRALELYRAHAGEDALETALSHSHLGQLLKWMGRSDEATRELSAAVPLLRRHGELRSTAIVLQTLGAIAGRRGRTDEALAHFREALALVDTPGEESLNARAGLLNDMSNLSGVDPKQGRAWLDEAIALRRESPSGRGELATALGNLVVYLVQDKDYAAAETAARECLELRRERYGPENPETANALTRLADVQLAQDKFADAEATAREALAMHRQTLPPGSNDLFFSLRSLGKILRKAGKSADAEPLLREARDISAQSSGETSTATAQLDAALAECLADLQRHAEAEPIFLRALDAVSNDPAGTRSLRAKLAAFYDQWGRPDEAAKYRPP